MGFYEELSRYYDEIFPVDSKEMAFIAGQVSGRKNLLDLGCGTGNKTVHCAGAVARITAVDLDPGMIARAKADNARLNIEYEVLDMTLVGVRFPANTFDAVICLGNTLVHLENLDAVTAFLGGVRACLARDGVLVLQILNYDRILDNGVRELPLLESAHAVFSRRYSREGNRLHFHTALRLKQTGECHDNDVPLYPLRRAELEGALSRTGFPKPALYGNYQGDPFTAESFALIAVCKG